MSDRPVRWITADSPVATESAAGLVQAADTGTVRVGAAVERRSDVTIVTVAPAAPPTSDSLVVVFQDDFESGHRSRSTADFRPGPWSPPRSRGAAPGASSGFSQTTFTYIDDFTVMVPRSP